ncbi:hypothetical protein H9P43_004862 [Blastocladiella emersonii ATCC 22665]|nr:hypothetical protein H9P43_004862 [Blastocladiella emersonii ATCC 22665]
MKKFIPALPATLQALSLRDNSLSDVTAFRLAKHLPPKLVTLDLGQNHIGRAGERALRNAASVELRDGLNFSDFEFGEVEDEEGEGPEDSDASELEDEDEFGGDLD